MKNLDLSDFPKNNLEDWMAVAEKQLKKPDPLNELSWAAHELSDLRPYYDANELASLTDQITFFQTLQNHRWKLYEDVTVIDEKEANKEALNALIGGCDGIIFHVQEEVDTEVLLKDINGSICDLSVIGSEHDRFSNYMNSENTVFEKQLSKSPVEQLSSIVKGIDGKSHVTRHAFPDFFIEISSVRALRYLLTEMKGADRVNIHSLVTLNENPEYQWFLNTTAALASILGGSNSISMPTTSGDKRITRNVGNLIRDESKIEAYTDQCGGSYYVESLTAKIIELVKAEIK